MRSLSALLLAALLASGCSESKPIAELTYSRIYQQPSAVAVEFDSNLKFATLYAGEKNKIVVVEKLVCALSDDQNFDIKHRLRHVFRGDLEMQGSPTLGDKSSYRYSSNGDFYQISADGTDRILLRREMLTKVLGTKNSVPCKVIMTRHMADPYYSAAMSVPVGDILKISNAKR